MPKSRKTVSFAVHEGNLFDLAKGPMCHCVSVDLMMGAGIAVQFKQRFGGLNELREQKPRVGKCLTLMRDARPIFYLVTKEAYYGKPTRRTLRAALVDMRSKMDSLGLEALWMPQIATGLDRMSWDKDVMPILRDVFEGWPGTLHVVKFKPKQVPEPAQTDIK